jgi:hypothetical protein
MTPVSYASDRSFVDLVDTVGVKGDVVSDRADGIVGSLIGPNGILGTLPARRNVEVGSIALVGQ